MFWAFFVKPWVNFYGKVILVSWTILEGIAAVFFSFVDNDFPWICWKPQAQRSEFGMLSVSDCVDRVGSQTGSV